MKKSNKLVGIFAHGGPRKNATGRPKLMDNRVKVSVTLDKTHLDTLDTYAKDHGMKRSEAVRRILERL